MRNTIKSIVLRIFDIDWDDFDILFNDEARFGVFSTNVAFKLSSVLKMSPDDISEKLVKNNENDLYIAKFDNGYVNFYLPENIIIKSYLKEGTFKLNDCDDKEYFIYRINFLIKRLEGECVLLDEIQYDEVFVKFFIQGKICKGIESFLKYDRKTVYTCLSDQEKNNFFTVINCIVSTVFKNVPE
ncbi:MAG: hypothetical protein U9Q80_07225 [Bacillota bacterium]|nr:hypothetical protein [Bacillota bacterium]